MPATTAAPTRTASSGNAPRGTAPPGLSLFELPSQFIEPTLRALRLWNTALDALFYDTGVLTAELRLRGELVTTEAAHVTQVARDAAPIPEPSFSKLDLSALANPEGCILVIDSARAPFVTRFDRVDDFIEWTIGPGADLTTVTITGVGSSALGSAAFAWNASVALGKRVAAIVPGYGVADVVNQALGGWYGFGVHDWIGALTQKVLAHASPSMARAGQRLLESTPGHKATETGGPPEFETGSAASDVLHALITHVPGISVLLGHSKGALAIGNALRSLAPATTRRLWVTTFGCPIDESVPVTKYVQFLGSLDPLGLLNAWGHKAERSLISSHSTNTMIPLSMPISVLLRGALASEEQMGDAFLAASGRPAAHGDATALSERNDAAGRRRTGPRDVTG
jgi:hypothetical protein